MDFLLMAIIFIIGVIAGWLARSGEVNRLNDYCDMYQQLLVGPSRGREGAE